jgi:hypothetical protein
VTDHSLSTVPGQLRPSALVRGRGWPQLLKGIVPAAGNNWVRTVPGEFWERPIALAFTLATSSTVTPRTLAMNFMDGDGNIYNQTQIAVGIPAGVTTSQYGDLIAVSPIQGGQTFAAEGSVTSPAATTQLAAVSLLPAGTYLVTATVNLAGTLSQATDANNIRIDNGGSGVYEILDNDISSFPQNFGPYSIDVPAGGTVRVATIGAGTAASVYSASLALTPAAYQGGFQFPDILMKSGHQLQVAVGNVQAADQLSGIFLLTERYPSADVYLRGQALADELAAVIAGYLIG